MPVLKNMKLFLRNMNCFYESIKVHHDQEQHMRTAKKAVQSREKKEEKEEL